jgi:hypothetical protein
MSWFSNAFGSHKNPADEANKYLNKIPGETKRYYKPYQEAGNKSLEDLQGRYGELLNDPGALFAELGKGYTQSPGYQLKLQQGLDQANNAMAMGGQLGTPQHQQLDSSVSQGIAGEDYEKYIQHILDMYGKGLSGEEGLNTQGFDANTSYAQMLAQLRNAQGNNAFNQTSAKNQAGGQNWSNLFRMLGTGAGYALGGPAGGWMGSQITGGR